MGERLGRIATSVLAGTVLGLGLDIGPKPADAQTPTPTATPTSTPTPDREIINKQATITALNEQLERARKLAEMRATETAIRDAINAALGTPTRTPTPTASPIPDPRDKLIAEEVAKIKATATAKAEATATARALAEVTPVPPRPAPGQPGGVKDEHDPMPSPDIGGLAPLALGAGGIAVGLWQRRRLWGWIRRKIH